LVLSGRVHRQRAETDNSHSNQHCCEYTYGGFSVDSMHKSASTSKLNGCQVEFFLGIRENILGEGSAGSSPERFFRVKKQNRDHTPLRVATKMFPGNTWPDPDLR